MTAADVREAFDTTTHRAEADQVVEAVRGLSRGELFDLLAAAGLEAIRRGDAKGYLLSRLRSRLTARVRARERSEV